MVTILAFTLLAMSLIDRVGRRMLLIAGSLGMVAFHFMLAAAFWRKHFEGYGILFCILGFIASFAFSQGTVIWVILSEIYPNRVRAQAQSIATLTHWVFAFLVSLLFPLMIKHLGGGGSFAFFGAAMVAHLIFVTRWVPETKGKSLEELETLLTAERRNRP